MANVSDILNNMETSQGSLDRRAAIANQLMKGLDGTTNPLIALLGGLAGGYQLNQVAAEQATLDKALRQRQLEQQDLTNQLKLGTFDLQKQQLQASLGNQQKQDTYRNAVLGLKEQDILRKQAKDKAILGMLQGGNYSPEEQTMIAINPVEGLQKVSQNRMATSIKDNENIQKDAQKLSQDLSDKPFNEIFENINTIKTGLSGDVSGVGLLAQFRPDITLDEKSLELRKAKADLIDNIGKLRSGAALNKDEEVRYRKLVEGAGSIKELNAGIKTIEGGLSKRYQSFLAGYRPEAVTLYQERGGLVPSINTQESMPQEATQKIEPQALPIPSNYLELAQKPENRNNPKFRAAFQQKFGVLPEQAIKPTKIKFLGFE